MGRFRGPILNVSPGRNGSVNWVKTYRFYLGYEMTGHSRNSAEHYPMSILDFIEQQDREAFMKEWEKIVVLKEEARTSSQKALDQTRK